MSLIRRIQIVEEPIPSLSLIETTSKTLLGFPSPLLHDLEFDLDLFDPIPSLFRQFTQIHRVSTYKYSPPASRLSGSDLYFLNTLSDRVAALESSVKRLVDPKPEKKAKSVVSYSWSAEINSDGVERKCQWSAKIKGDEKKKKKKEEEVTESKEKVKVKNYKWTSEIKGKGEHAPVHKYTVEVSSGSPKEKKEKQEKKETHEKKEKKEKKEAHHNVEIEEIPNPGSLVLRQVFAKRAEAINAKGKKKELSPQDAAIRIQSSFRAYLIRRSKALRGLRELAVAKNKLKELRKLFNNFSYRRHIAQDAEECQKFTERIIVVLLTVDAIELNASRIRVLQAQDDVVNSMKEAAAKELLKVSEVHYEYRKLLKNLIVQSVLRLKEPAVLLRCRKDDLRHLEHILDSTKEDYAEKANVHAPEILVDADVHLPPGPHHHHHLFSFHHQNEHGHFCAGGILMASRDGKIVCENTLDARLHVVYLRYANHFAVKLLSGQGNFNMYI